MSESDIDLNRIAESKAKILAELNRLEALEAKLGQEQASGAFAEVISLLQGCGPYLSGKQKAEIISLLGEEKPKGKKGDSVDGRRVAVSPKYQLPHNGETWTGRGKMPKAFAAWMETVAFREWFDAHPGEKFPAYRGLV